MGGLTSFPILFSVTMGDEAQAYICFCAVMKRLNANFMLDGVAMTLKFTHLSEALQFYDPEFFEYLKQQQADDLLFCYRWLLLEMKREFAFEDSLRMLEVLWSSLPSEPPATELPLFEKEFVAPVDIPPPKSPSAIVMRAPRENAYIKLCNLRRQSSSQSLLPTSPNTLIASEHTTKSLDTTKRLNQSLDENISRNQCARYVKKSFQSLDETKMASMLEHHAQMNALHEKDAAVSATELDGDCVDSSYLNVNENLKNKHRSRSPSPKGAVETGCGDQGDSDLAISKGNQQSGSIGLARKGHFKELKERLAASKKGILLYI